MDFSKYIKDNQLKLYDYGGDSGVYIDIEGFSVVKSSKNNNWYVDLFGNNNSVLMFKGDLNNIITFLADMFYHDIIIEYEL
jgi:hypothetical protein